MAGNPEIDSVVQVLRELVVVMVWVRTSVFCPYPAEIEVNANNSERRVPRLMNINDKKGKLHYEKMFGCCRYIIISGCCPAR